MTWKSPANPELRLPIVSVAIPVYNGANFITHAIESVLNQDFTDLELIVCDNASDDRTAQICEWWASQDKRLRYFRNERNLGAAANYNRSLALARGRYFKWLAHDDWISPNYLEACTDALDRHPEAALAYGMPQEMLDQRTAYLNSTYTVPLWGNAGPVERFGKAMRLDRTCHAIFGLIRRHVLEQTTLHRPYYTSDKNLVAEIALLGRFIAVPEATFFNRRHAHQSMANSARPLYLNAWQDTANTRPYATLWLSRLRHFIEITGRYPRVASRAQLFNAAAGHFFAPSTLVRYADEMAGMTMPHLYARLRNAAKFAFRKLRPLPPYVKQQKAPKIVSVPVAERQPWTLPDGDRFRDDGIRKARETEAAR